MTEVTKGGAYKTNAEVVADLTLALRPHTKI